MELNRMRSSRERGSMLALVLLMIIPLAGLAGALLTLGTRQSEEIESSRGRAVALLNAEAGLDAALVQLKDDFEDLTTVEAFEDDGVTLRYQVVMEALGDDAIDNDSDGDTDEEDEEKLVRITSRGSLNVLDWDGAGNPVTKDGRWYAKTLRAFGRRLDEFPAFPYAVYLGDPNAEIQFNGNAFQLDGNDYLADLSPGPAAAVPGIGTTGDPDDIIDQINTNQYDNVAGIASDPSVQPVAAVDLDEIIDTYKSSADIVLYNPGADYAGSFGDPDTAEYKVVYVEGNLDLSGGGEGAGVLLIDGNLEVTGSWNYQGIVIVTGQVVFKGGGGEKRVMGTLLVGGDVIESQEAADEDLLMAGTIDILYSSTIQEQVSQALADVTLFAWQEL